MSNAWQDRQLSEAELIERERAYECWVASGMGEGELSETEKKALREAKALRNVLLFVGIWVVLAGTAFVCRYGWSLSR